VAAHGHRVLTLEHVSTAPRRPLAALLVTFAAASTLAACGGSNHPKTAAAPSSPSPSVSPSPAPSPSPVGPPSPLSGLPAPAGAPVLAVKIDNTAAARPQAGLEDADIVYVEQVEGGLTRLLAVFSSRIPKAVGPVRSVRTDNLDLVAQLGGPVAFSFSGGQPAAVAVVRSSPILDVSYDAFPGLYRREPGRPAPYNLFADPAALLHARQGVQQAKSIGWVFDEARAPTDGVGDKVAATYPGTRLAFQYLPASHTYGLLQDGVQVEGTDGTQLSAANVIVQRVGLVFTGLKDIKGSFSPATLSTGGGDATVLRDGHSIDATWSRPTRMQGTRWQTRRSRVDVALRPGTTWVLLLPNGSGLSLT
jgi:hypothetical protein